MTTTEDRVAVVLGAKNLGGAIAEAVQFLAEQEPRAYTHELMLTPAGDRWVP